MPMRRSTPCLLRRTRASDPRSGFARSSWKAGGRLNKSTNAGRQCMNTVQDDVVMAGASGTQTVAATDGRSLTIAEWGDPGGFPVFLLHGTPGSRFVGQADASAYASVGARVIAYDRPGGSDRFRGRRVVDSVADVSAIADSLGIERFAVIGGSWGGPHSLAVAARLPERLARGRPVWRGSPPVRHAWLRLVREHGRGEHR